MDRTRGRKEREMEKRKKRETERKEERNSNERGNELKMERSNNEKQRPGGARESGCGAGRGLLTPQFPCPNLWIPEVVCTFPMTFNCP